MTFEVWLEQLTKQQKADYQEYLTVIKLGGSSKSRPVKISEQITWHALLTDRKVKVGF